MSNSLTIPGHIAEADLYEANRISGMHVDKTKRGFIISWLFNGDSCGYEYVSIGGSRYRKIYFYYEAI